MSSSQAMTVDAARSPLTIQVCRPTELSTDDWKRWSTLQQQNAALASPYFRPEFTQAVSRAREDVEVAMFRASDATVGFLPFQRGQLSIGKPVGGKLCDSHGVIAAEDFRFSPEQFLATAKLSAWDFEQLPKSQVDFAPFAKSCDKAPGLELKDGYEGWCEIRREQGSQVVSKTMQKVRKLAREHGELTHDLCSDSAAMLDQLIAWKSPQYVASGIADVFSFPWTRSLLEQLWTTKHSEFGGWLSVLRAGSRVVSITFSLRSRNVMHAWFTAYDRELSSYSPGLVQFMKLTQDLPSVGITRFELGKGDERFKWNLATDSQEVLEGSVTRRSLGTWLRSSWRTTRDWVNRTPLASTVGGGLLKPLRQWLAYR